MKEQLIKLMVQIDKMKSTTEIKNAIAEIIIKNDYTESKTDNTTEIEIRVDGKNCCMPSACVSNCGACDANVNTTLSLPEPEKCCLIM
jgi:leucyl aminopeptidase (aminopeptidase T)